MNFEFKTAWRELASSWRRFLIAIIAVGIGVGALSGVKGFSEALHSAMLKQARELIAADFTVRISGEPNDAEQQILAQLRARGAESTATIETISMSAAVQGDRPILVSVKAVDPKSYPYYGKVELVPELALADALGGEGATVSEDYLQRLGIGVGQRIQLGAVELQVRAVLRKEPDRLASGLEFGPRIMVSLDNLWKANLIQTGSRVSRFFLHRIVRQPYDLDEMRRLVESTENRLRVTDYRRPNPQLDRGLERMETFLSLVSLISLLVGALGVAMSMHAYLQEKMDSIAVLKMLGGRSAQILRIYLYQAMLLGLAGCMLGLLIGFAVQAVFPSVIAGLIDLPVELDLAPMAMAQAFCVGMLSTVLLVFPPLLDVRRISPLRVLRRNMEGDNLFSSRNWRADRGWTVISAVGLLLALGGIASWLSGSWQRGFGFMGFFLGAVLVLLLVARSITALIPRLFQPRTASWKHGVANLHRPGSHSTAIFAALAIGVMLTATIYLMQSSLLKQLMQSAPADFPNLVIIGIPEKDKDPLFQTLRHQPGIVDPGTPIPYLPGRLSSVDGVPLEEYQQRTESGAAGEGGERQTGGPQRGTRRRFGRGEFQITWSQDPPPDTRINEGRWWQGRPTEPEVSVADYFAEHLSLRVGMVLEFHAAGKTVKARLTSIRSVGFARPGSNNAFIFSPGALDGFPFSYVLNARMRPDAAGLVQKALFERFPSVTSINVGEILDLVQKLLDRISVIIQYVAGFAILAGMMIMASAVASTRQRRIRESVLLKTLGATRSLVRRIHDVEFLVLGSTAGAMGTLAANGLAWYLLGHLLDTPYVINWISLLGGTIATATLAVLTGRLASRGFLNQKPLQVLREE